MADETHELAVRLSTVGAEETEEDLDRVDKKFDRVAESTEDTAGMLDDVAKNLVGAAGVVTAGLGLAAAGLLSQLPVVGEAASGLGAILDNLLLKIDEDVRPAINDLSSDFFDLAEDVGEADSAAEAIGKTLGGFADILTDRIQQQTDGLTVETTVDFVVEVGTVTFETSDFLQGIKQRVESGQIVLDTLRFSLGGQAAFAKFSVRVLNRLARWINRRVREDFGPKLESAFRDAWELAENAVKEKLDDMAADIESTVNDIIQVINQIPGLDFDPVSIDSVDTRSQTAGQRSRARLTGGGGGGSGADLINRQIERLIGELQGAPQRTTFQVDGRAIVDSIGPLLGSNVANRGR